MRGAETVLPQLIVCLGAVAAQALLGAGFRITQSHGEVQKVEGLPPIAATLHPPHLCAPAPMKTGNATHGYFLTTCAGSSAS